MLVLIYSFKCSSQGLSNIPNMKLILSVNQSLVIQNPMFPILNYEVSFQSPSLQPDLPFYSIQLVILLFPLSCLMKRISHKERFLVQGVKCYCLGVLPIQGMYGFIGREYLLLNFYFSACVFFFPLHP